MANTLAGGLDGDMQSSDVLKVVKKNPKERNPDTERFLLGSDTYITDIRVPETVIESHVAKYASSVTQAWILNLISHLLFRGRCPGPFSLQDANHERGASGPWCLAHLASPEGPSAGVLLSPGAVFLCRRREVAISTPPPNYTLRGVGRHKRQMGVR